MRATFAINSTARRISIGSRLALLACTKYYALSAAANLLEQFVITEIHQKRHRTAGVTAPGYRFVGAETRLQQTGTAGLLRRIRWHGCSAFATKFACCDSHRPAIPFTYILHEK